MFSPAAVLAASIAGGPALAATPPLPVPKDTKLVGATSVAEIREFPEEAQARGSSHVVEEAQAVRGLDQLYETAGP